MMNDKEEFPDCFAALTDHDPFPWQHSLYQDWFAQGKIPASCKLPTGLGKTNVIAVWLIALLRHPDKMPRRLVYVVNRRTVVDQTTDEVEKLRRNLLKVEPLPNHMQVLAISTLRGQFADNHEWSADPSRPAVIVGTVDMIGSRLLFSGYGVGYKAKPLHAGFLGQDVLLVHDEAHLEPAFQELLVAIEKEQGREREFSGELPWPELRVMELTATSRGEEDAFTLGEKDWANPVVKQRINAKKAIQLREIADEKKIADRIAELALAHKDSGRAVLVYVRRVEDVDAIMKKLSKYPVEQLTGTMRGLERDSLVKRPVFQRFLPGSNRDPDITPESGTAYLVCTSAGEVGVNISADHMVCDISTFESMAQRLGRINRFGEHEDSRVDIVHPREFNEKDPLTPARRATLQLLQRLDGDGSPAALSNLDLQDRIDAFTPIPTMLDATEILFDAWALTSITERMPGRPEVAPYLHGIAEWEPPRTSVAWRMEVEHMIGDLRNRYKPQDLLDDYPLKPHELLSDTSERISKSLELLSSRSAADTSAWIVDERGDVEPVHLKELFVQDKKRIVARIANRTIVLPPSAGGLTKQGLLDGSSDYADDVADITTPPTERRVRVWSNDPKAAIVTAEMRLTRSIEFSSNENADEEEPLTWNWYKHRPLEDARTAQRPVLWSIHVGDVVLNTNNILAGLSLPREIAQAIRIAARLHDHGKRRAQFQLMLGNRSYPKLMLAKSGRVGAKLLESYRHEFGSLLDAMEDAEFRQLSQDLQDLVLHLIAAHHGRGRPHFPSEEAFDPERPSNGIAAEVPRRFARLQRKYGRWGLAYLESLLRAADWAASAAPSAYADETEVSK